MNSIPEKQNSKRQLQLLAAQRQLYATAKTVFGWHFIVSGPITVLLAFSAIIFPELKSLVALLGILMTLGDISLFTPWQKSLRYKAAQVQELFDCGVFDLEWNELKTGNRPDPELIKEQAEKYKLWASTMPTLLDWYPTVVGYLPMHIARLVCQRSNCWWDAVQRRRYATTVIILGVSIFTALLFFVTGNNSTIQDFLLKVVAPLSPLLILAYRQSIEQLEAAKRLDKIKEHSERLWADALAGKPEPIITVNSRNLQDEIFENRKRNPLVFDAIFKRFRSNYEIQMNHGACELAIEAKERLGLTW